MFIDVPDVYLCNQFVDFRKSINGLAAIVESELELS
ncbi:IS66 family insertion sequence element accessory protein TnpB, partial [Pseudoalteromonas sp. MER144-MNA-CIBAN-0113]